MFAQKAVTNKYPSAKVIGQPIGGRTGCFEITVTRADGKSKKIHSKLNGDGFVTPENVEVMMKNLEDYLAEK
jgi:selT/selW/selH-like putative selenoprotein